MARQRARSLLLVAQVAVSFMLLIGAGLMLRSFIKLQQVNPGFSPENVLTMRVDLNWSKYMERSQMAALYESLSGDGTDFINGDIISVDGGEFITGS